MNKLTSKQKSKSILQIPEHEEYTVNWTIRSALEASDDDINKLSSEKRDDLKNRLPRIRAYARELTRNELKSHYALTLTTTNNYSILLEEFCSQVIEEYDCKTPSEIALAEIVAGSFVRHLRIARRLEEFVSDGWLSNERNGMMAVLSKELDRASRMYLSSLMALKQIKSPKVDLNVIAKNAFIAQNQQFNSSHKPL